MYCKKHVYRLCTPRDSQKISNALSAFSADTDAKRRRNDRTCMKRKNKIDRKGNSVYKSIFFPPFYDISDASTVIAADVDVEKIIKNENESSD